MRHLKSQFLNADGLYSVPPVYPHLTYLRLEKRQPAVNPEPSPWDVERQRGYEQLSDYPQEQHQQREANELPLRVSDIRERPILVRLRDQGSRPREIW